MGNSSQPYRLGVDIGTSSVAWAAVGLSESGQPVRFLATGLSIFGEPVEPKELKLKNEVRRKARLMRRQLTRKRARIAKLVHIAEKLGVTVADLHTAQKRLKRTHDLWELRVKALDQRVELPELILITLRMAKNRGYWGRRPSPNKKGDLGKVGKGISEMDRLMRETHARTIAEALVLSQRDLPPEHRKYRKLVEGGCYVMREDVEKEFDLIIEQQKKHHPILSAALESVWGPDFVARLERDRSKESGQGSKEFWGYVPRTVAEALRHTIFYQRPLQSFKDKIGKCPFVPGDLRVVAAHPAFQEFRIEKLLNDLGWGEPREAEPLSDQQKNILRKLLNEQGSVKFSKIYEELKKADCMHPNGLTLNFHTSRRDHLVGNTTRQMLRKFKLLDEFESLTPKAQGDVFTALANDINAPEAWGKDDARKRVIEMYGEAVATFIDRLDGANDGLERLREMGFNGQRVRYGETALRALARLMREKGLNEHDAVAKLYPHAAATANCIGTLPEVSTLGIRSPVVTHALEYTRRELLAATRRLGGPPAAIVIELARPLKTSLEDRKKLESLQRAEERANEEARKAILAANCRISRGSILRYKLWKQQAKRCPYSGEAILSIEEALDGAKYDIDHIVPKRLHGVGDRFDDVVLASKKYNALKGPDETPYLAAHHERNKGKWDWERTEQAVKAILKENRDFRKKADLILNRTAFRLEGMNDEEFVDRQLQETQWVGRVVHAWCKHLCNDVTVVRGGLTAALRKAWGLDSVLPAVREAEGKHSADPLKVSDKQRAVFFAPIPHREDEYVFEKRSDHRQHIVDACVIALSERRNYQALVRARNRPGREFRPPACPIPGLREHLVRMLQNYEVWHVPDRLVHGLMFDQEPFGLEKDGKTLVKKGEKAKRSLHPKLDRIIKHPDRHGRVHYKVVVKSEMACFRLTEEGIEPMNIADFRLRYLKGKNGHQLVIPGGERLFFKNDIIAVPPDDRVWRIAQLKERGGLCCVPTTETATFDELTGTGLTRTFSKVADLRNAKVFHHPAELAAFVKQKRNHSARACEPNA